MNKFLRICLLMIPAIICMAWIFHLSAETAAQSSETSETVIHEILLRVDPQYAEETEEEQKVRVDALQFFVRKGAHFSLYALLSVLILLPLTQVVPSFPAASVWAFIGTVLYAFSDEWHQSFVPGRSNELKDVLIDSSGALCGILLLTLLRTLYLYIQKKRDS